MRQLPPIDQRTLPHAIRKALEQHPDKVAQRGPEGDYTFAECTDRSLRIAGGIAKLGARFQNTVAIMLDNSLDFVHLWLGLGLTGVVEVPVNTAYKGRFLTHMLTDSAAKVLVIEENTCHGSRKFSTTCRCWSRSSYAVPRPAPRRTHSPAAR